MEGGEVIVCGSAGLWVCRSVGLQVFRSAGLQVCRSAHSEGNFHKIQELRFYWHFPSGGLKYQFFNIITTEEIPHCATG
jgi:hypothetical protein